MRRFGTLVRHLAARMRTRLVGDPTPPMTLQIGPAEAQSVRIRSLGPPRSNDKRPVTPMSPPLCASRPTSTFPVDHSTPDPTSTPSAETPPSKRRRQPGDTAPEFLLQAPTGITPVVDDFFDGVTRHVEGDR